MENSRFSWSQVWLCQLLSASLFMLLGACYDSPSNDRRATPYPQIAPVVASDSNATAVKSGEALYAQYCESCHNPLATSERAGAKAPGIANAIATIPAMAKLKSLKQEEINAIATVLSALKAADTTVIPAVIEAEDDEAADDDEAEDDDADDAEDDEDAAEDDKDDESDDA